MKYEPGQQGRREFLLAALATVTAPALISAVPATAAEAILVETANGWLRGARDNGVVSFKGVAFAADTGGRNRFMAPQPVSDWLGVRDAVEFGDRCPQGGRPGAQENAGPSARFSENCCVLNVYTPDLNPGARRPVMFYIHGGGFSTGSGDGPTLDGSNLAKFGDVVVVTVNHRLNVFGYTQLAHLNRDFADAANAGQLDLVAALGWVKTNIGVFGGDPQNVTAFGESGGGAKIVALSVMPHANGLFHRTINMSGPSAFFLGSTVEAEPLTNELLKVLGVDVARLRKLQEIPAEQLLAAHAKAMANLKSDQSRPVVDERHIFHAPMSPEGIAMQATIPGILSRTSTEATAWLVSDLRNLQVTAEQLRTRLEKQYGLEDAKAAAVIEDYRHDDPNRTPWDVLVAVASEALIRSPMRHAAEARCRVGGAPVYLCDFNWKSPVDDGIWARRTQLTFPSHLAPSTRTG